MAYKIWGLVLSLLLLFGVMFPLAIPRAKSAGNTITVPDDFPTIQEAINNANDGDTIYVRAGTYYENIEVNNIISLTGENAQNTIIDGGWLYADVIHVTANNVDIKSFTAQHSSGAYLLYYAGIDLDNVNACTVEGNIVEQNGWDGIDFTGYGNKIVGNSVIDNWQAGISGSSTNATVSGNTIGGNEFGVALRGSGISVIGNNILRNSWGVVLSSASNDSVIENNVLSYYCGVYFADSPSNDIIRNNITGCADPRVEQYAFYFGASGNNTIAGNNVTNNNCIVHSFDNSSYCNTFYNNNFVGNTVKLSGAPTQIWDNGYPSGGNYWDDYTGQDVCSGPYQSETGSDGIGDTPYIIDANNTDNYPLTIHDVAVSNAATPKTIVGKGYTISINATVQNTGNYNETFNVTVYANATTIYQTQITLTARNATTLIFQCNTTSLPYGNYTLCASASNLPNETDTSDNNYTCSFPIHLGVPGDISSSTTGVYDGRVNMRDIAGLVNFFSTNPNSPNWNPNADINNDGTVNMKDIAIAVAHFNQHE